MGLIEDARKGNPSETLSVIAKRESVSIKTLARSVAEGRVSVLHNGKRPLSAACAVGEGLRTKVNANIGSSPDYFDISMEIKKAHAAVEAGADTIMDLSTGGDIAAIRARILEEIDVPLGTVPIYEAAGPLLHKGRGIEGLEPSELLEIIEKQAEEGVDFMTLHCGINRNIVESLERYSRVMDVVSRGGSLIIEWMIRTGRENPLLEQYDKVLAILRKHDITLSLGDGMRPGCIADSTDEAQLEELKALGVLAQRAIEGGVQVLVEGPGHIPVHQVAENVRLQKECCHRAPFYVLGPLVTDVAPGHDHIGAAIGGAIAAAAGADFLCYVTPTEHLALPDIEDVREGVIAAMIAAHAGDIAKGVKGAAEWDLKLSRLRRKRDWDAQSGVVLDPVRFKQLRRRGKAEEDDVCTMCGSYCSLKTMERCYMQEKADI